jgi:sugar lactone lactonase YvrE
MAVVAALALLAVLVSGCTPAGPGALVRLSNLGVRSPGPAACQELPRARTLAVSSSGTVYFVGDDSPGTRIYKVAKGVLSVVAGTGAWGYSGNGGPATAATFRRPEGLWIDRTGLYIADTGNNRVRKVDGSTGIITTVAGNGHTGRSSNSIATHALLEAPSSLWANGTGGLDIGNRFGGAYLNLTTHALTATSTHSPLFAVDPAHNTYSFPASVAHPADTYPYAPVLRYPNHSSTATPFAGRTSGGSDADGTPALDAHFPNQIIGLAADPSGTLYISTILPTDPYPYNDIESIDAATHTLHTVTGFGGYDAEDAAITVAPNGDLYAAVNNGSTIVRRDHTTATVSLVAGGLDTPACPDLPVAAWTPGGVGTASTTDAAGNVYLATHWQALDQGTGLYELTSDGNVVTLEGNKCCSADNGDGGPIAQASFGYIAGLGLDGAGNLYLADPSSASVREVDHATGIVTTVATSLGTIHGLAVNAAGDLFIAERTGTANGSIREVDHTTHAVTTVAGAATGGTTPTSTGTAADQAVVDPASLTLGAGGSLYYGTATQAFRYDPPVSPATIGNVTRIAGTGAVATATGLGDGGPATSAPLASETQRVALVDGAGNVYLVGGRTVQRIDAGTGTLHTLYVAAASRVPGSTTPPALSAPTLVGTDLDLTIGGTFDVGGHTGLPSGDVYRLLGPATAPENLTPR